MKYLVHKWFGDTDRYTRRGAENWMKKSFIFVRLKQIDEALIVLAEFNPRSLQVTHWSSGKIESKFAHNLN